MIVQLLTVGRRGSLLLIPLAICFVCFEAGTLAVLCGAVDIRLRTVCVANTACSGYSHLDTSVILATFKLYHVFGACQRSTLCKEYVSVIEVGECNVSLLLQ